MWAYLNLRNDGRNYIPANAAGGGFAPTDPTTTYLNVVQGYPNTGIVALQTIQVRSSLPTLPELTDSVPSTAGASPSAQTSILTDLRPDSTGQPNTYQMQSTYVESGLGQIRWLKMAGRGALTTFTLSLWWTDLMGKARQIFVVNQTCAVKLCFARRSIIDNWAFSYGEQEETLMNAPLGDAPVSYGGAGRAHLAQGAIGLRKR